MPTATLPPPTVSTASRWRRGFHIALGVSCVTAAAPLLAWGLDDYLMPLGARRMGTALVRASASGGAIVDGDWSRALSGGVRLARVGPLPVGLDAGATVWDRDGRGALYASGGLTGAVGRARLTLGYRLTQSPTGDRTLTTHGLDASVYAPLTDRPALSLRGSVSDGDGLSHARLYSALWVRL